MIKFSIVVPVYKVEPYIHKCVDSILNQTYKNFEVILVDDGSPDNCGKICDEYAEKDRRVKVIHKENGGLSSARNAGIDVATGEFIVFVDSDDYIDVNMLLEIETEITSNQSEVVIYGLNIVTRNKISEQIFNQEDTDKIKLNLLTDKWKNYACNKCFKRSLFRYKRFPKGMYFEDLYLVPEVCLAAKKITVIEKCYYFYNCANENSITSKMNSRKRFDLFWAYKKNKELFETLKLSDVDIYIYIYIYQRLKKLCIDSAKKCFFSYCADKELDKEKIAAVKCFLMKEQEKQSFRDKFWVKQILNNNILICRLYAKIRGY